MLKTLGEMLGFGPKVDYKMLIENGAKIIDVRTPDEYAQGHIKSSENLPLQDLSNSCSRLNKETTIITCCASGMRSAAAKSLLKKEGFKEVHNGGGWLSLEGKI